jgi:hypothetical protein
MRCSKTTRLLFLILTVGLVPLLPANLMPRAHADLPFSLNAVPANAPEGTTVSLILSVTGAVQNIQYEFRFSVTDPLGTTIQSGLLNFTTGNQDTFTMTVLYPSPSLQGPNNLVGQYRARVDELFPTPSPNVAATSFILTITNSLSYQRTQTITIQASGYNASESVTVTIKTQTSSTTVYTQTLAATSAGVVATTWKIPKNATIDNYIVTLTGTSTFKSKPDTQTVSVTQAILTISSIITNKSSYQRTETMRFSFQPTYPDGTIATTGTALLTLAPPAGSPSTLTATYNSTSQIFGVTYKTLVTDTTGTWTASLSGHAYSDPDGNSGPGITVSTGSQLTIASLTINLNTNTAIAVGQQLKFNASITYPDGTLLQTGTLRAYLVYSGTPSINDTVPVTYDSGLQLWFGTYTVKPTDTGGLWTLAVTASDSPNPANTGTITRAMTIQNTTSGSASFPLFYFGIIAALIAALLASVLLLLRRRKVTQTRLKIDLESIQAEAGKIESSDFFKSVQGQVRKEKEKK